jgi:Carboxypeptidase regulatory-like domain
MKYIRGLSQSDSVVIANPVACFEEDKARIHRDEQSKFRHVATRKNTKLRVCMQILPIFAILLVLNVTAAVAQSTFGSVRGIVQDNTGAVISDTQIVLHSRDENTERTVNADASGSFIFENVKAGNYNLRAHHDGFADTVLTGIYGFAERCGPIDYSRSDLWQRPDQYRERDAWRLKGQPANDAASSEQSRDNNQPARCARPVAQCADGQLGEHRAWRGEFLNG